MRTARTSKVCASCGRAFTWRKKWAKNWEQVRYCSTRCRSKGTILPQDPLIQAVFDALKRVPSKRACTVDAIEQALHEQGHSAQQTRVALRTMIHAGQISSMEGNKRIAPERLKGNSTLRLMRPPALGSSSNPRDTSQGGS